MQPWITWIFGKIYFPQNYAEYGARATAVVKGCRGRVIINVII